MKFDHFHHWQTAIQSDLKRPAYLLIADLIAQDIEKGSLQNEDRLPPIRELSEFLDLDYTTVTRGYKEAASRGLIESRRGIGSYVKGRKLTVPLRNGSDIEMSMNMPPDPVDRNLAESIRQDIIKAASAPDFFMSLRYQDFGGTERDKQAAASLLSKLIPDIQIERLLVCPGIHSILVALLHQHCKNEKSLAVEPLVYPGLKAIATQLGIKLQTVKSDTDGPIISVLEELCRREKINALYLNPTIRNPNTTNMSIGRRKAIADVALRYNLKIIEDDAYGLLPEQAIPPIATFAPEITHYITGLSKCFNAGCRIGYLYSPSAHQSQLASGALRAMTVMASPITTNMQTKWIESGTVELAIASIREEVKKRQVIAEKYLHRFKYRVNKDGFHLWLNLPKGLQDKGSEIAIFLRSKGVPAVSSAAFSTDNSPEAALRVCLGGTSNSELERQLKQLNKTLTDENNELQHVLN